MKDLVRIFKSPEGDVYHIALSDDYVEFLRPSGSKRDKPERSHAREKEPFESLLKTRKLE